MSNLVFYIFDENDSDSLPLLHSTSLRSSIQKQNGKVLNKYCDLLDKQGKYGISDAIDDPSNLFIVIKQQKRDFRETV